MRNPKVAIIIPNYNKEKYLIECINSVINQTYKNIEIIIIDDHSTDHSDTIIKKTIRNSKNVKYYRLPENHGVSYARNFGAKKTNADFLTFLDSDDIYINKQKIENEVKIAKKNKIAFSQWVPMNKDSKIQPYQTYTKNPFRSFAISKILSISLPSYKQLRGYMIPASLFKKIGGYDANLSYYEDFDLQCRLSLNAKFIYTQKTGEAYRLGTGGLSSRSIQDAQNVISSIQHRYISKLNPIQKIKFHIYTKYITKSIV